MTEKDSNFWEDRLRSFEEESIELREKTRQLEQEIKNLEGSLYRKNISRYRASLVEKARKTFKEAFLRRDEIPPEPALRDEWEENTGTMKACLTILNSISTEEAAVCGSVEELRNFLENEIRSGAEAPDGEIAGILNNNSLS